MPNLTRTEKRATEIILRVVDRIDQNGPWWETVNENGSTDVFMSGTAEYTPPMKFKNAEAAKQFAVDRGYTYFKVLQQTEPYKGKQEWEKVVLYDATAGLAEAAHSAYPKKFKGGT